MDDKAKKAELLLLENRIIRLTDVIRQVQPDLYRNLMETPVLLENSKKGITKKALADYLQSLHLQLTTYTRGL
jgi:hypothetical protein